MFHRETRRADASRSASGIPSQGQGQGARVVGGRATCTDAGHSHVWPPLLIPTDVFLGKGEGPRVQAIQRKRRQQPANWKTATRSLGRSTSSKRGRSRPLSCNEPWRWVVYALRLRLPLMPSPHLCHYPVMTLRSQRGVRYLVILAGSGRWMENGHRAQCTAVRRA